MLGASPAKPLVSIVIPTFNSAQYIERALSSAIAQSYSPIEIIIVDNGSNDETPMLVERYAEQNTNLYFYRSPHNVGPVANWRKGVSLATGKYAALLFSDDWYDVDFLEASVPSLADETVGFAFCCARRVDEGSLVAHDRLPPARYRSRDTPTLLFKLPQEGLLPTSTYLSAVLAGSGVDVPKSPACAVFRRADLKAALDHQIDDPWNMRYLDHGAGPDLWIYLQACIKYEYFAYRRTPAVNFRARADALSARSITRAAYIVASLTFYERYHPAQVNEIRVKSWLFYNLLRVKHIFPDGVTLLRNIRRDNNVSLIYVLFFLGRAILSTVLMPCQRFWARFNSPALMIW